jgi:F0F1-type ATP synthase assembly protein I
MGSNAANKKKTTLAADGHQTVDSFVPQSQFLYLVMNMSWQLAIVFLIPIIGGYELDHKFKHSPIFTVTGFVIAIIGVVFVLRSTVKLAANPTNTRKKV